MSKHLVKVDLSNGESARFYVTADNSEGVMDIIKKEDWYKSNHNKVTTFVKVSEIVQVTIAPQ